MSARALIPAVMLAALLAACAGAPTAPIPREYDLGPAPLATPGAAGAQVLSARAPVWLDGTGISYRLDFQDGFRREHYRDSRWVAPPADLIAARLRAALAAPASASTLPRLRLELEECEQRFSDPGHARVVVRLAATLEAPGAPAGSDGRREIFEVEVPSPSPDALGAVKGTALAADMVVMRVRTWLAGMAAP